MQQVGCVLGRAAAALVAVSAAGLCPGQTLTSTVVAAGLTDPVQVVGAPGDTARIFIVERAGRVRVVKNGQLLATPFLDVSSLVTTVGYRGLLGLAFDPDFATNRYVYVSYTKTSTEHVIVRYRVSVSNPDIVETASATQVISLGLSKDRHTGGWIGFSPVDGYLYIGRGENGGGNASVRDAATLNGKILRIDVDQDDFPTDASRNYGIPSGNPFAQGGGAPEVWAIGLRNPWRCSFDSLGGDLWIADVGGSLTNPAQEEINVLGAGQSGVDLGWSYAEGMECTVLVPSQEVCESLTPPLTVYTHVGGRCAIIGGPLYRGSAFPTLRGEFFFADYCSSEVFTVRRDAFGFAEIINRSAALGFDASGGAQILGMGADTAGEVYVCRRLADDTGEVRRIHPPCPGGCEPACPADFDAQNGVQVADIFAFLRAWFANSPSADFDSQNGIQVADIFAFLRAWFAAC